jgi:hypothetical protein
VLAISSVTGTTLATGTSTTFTLESAVLIEMVDRVAVPPASDSVNGSALPENVSPDAIGRISMPTRFRNVCNNAAAASPDRRKVTPKPSDSA